MINEYLNKCADKENYNIYTSFCKARRPLYVSAFEMNRLECF